jgi:hypothetical protein
MDLITTLRDLARTSRILALEDRSKAAMKVGDFEGSVLGVWQRVDSSGAGIVEYKGKEYTTKRQGFTSLFKNAKVQLTYVDGVYYSSW